ncbi:MAG: hypothetical protein ACLP8S_04450 [Solirubrobacteraceae bacterium]
MPSSHASRILGFWAEKTGGGIRERFDRDRRGVEVADGDRDREVVAATNSDPAAAGGSEGQERLFGAVGRDLSFRASGRERGDAPAAIDSAEPEGDRGVGEIGRAGSVDLFVDPLLEFPAATVSSLWYESPIEVVTSIRGRPSNRSASSVPV